MPDIEKTLRSFERNNYKAVYFDTSEEACSWLDGQIDGTTVGFGDSTTMIKMGLYDKLVKHNTVYDPMHRKENETFLEIAPKTIFNEVFLTSANAVSEDGEMVNIDNTGNRVAGSLYGHDRIYFIVGINKIEPDLQKAIYRARNIAGPKNALKYDLPTPCAEYFKKTGEYKCFDCSSPKRLCNSTVIYNKRMANIKEAVVVLIGEELGF